MSKKEATKKSFKETTKKDSLKNAKPINQQAEEQRRMKQKQILDNLNQQNMMKYLKNLESSSNKQQQTSKYALQSIEKIAQSLQSGFLLLPENSQPLPLKPSNPPKLTYEQQKQIENKAKRQNTLKKIQYFYDQIRGQNHNSSKRDASPPPQFKQILTKQEHERRVRQIMQLKEQQQKRLQQLHEQQQRKLKQQQQKLKQQRQAQQLKAKQQKKAKIQENLLKRKKLHEKTIQEQIKHEKQRQALNKQPKLYQQMQQKYKSQILLPYLEEKKLRLKELREFKKQYETDAIKQHQKQYLQKSLQRSREKKQTQSEWKYDPPAKTERLAMLLQEEQTQLRNQLEARQRRIQSMKEHQQLFKIDLKQKYKPKVDQLKRKEVQNRCLQHQKKDTASAAQQRQIGKQYLQMAKKLNRSESLKLSALRPIQSSNSTSALKLQTKDSFVKTKNHSHQFYENMRRKKIEEIVNSEQNTASQKFMMLKMEAQKIGVKLKQKQMFIKYELDDQARQDATDLILSSIKAKMGIVNLLKQKTELPIKKS